MGTTWRLLKAEGKKLLGSSCARMVWALPVLFILMEFFFFEYRLLGLVHVPEDLKQIIDTVQITMAGALWGGFFYPILIALLPALIFRVEHRNAMWRHLGTMPISSSQVYAIKAVWVIILSLVSLVLVWLLFMLEQTLIRFIAPQLEMEFHGLVIATVLGWLWLGSLPVASIYLWVSNRINSLSVPIVLGVVGILLSSALTSQEVPQPWKRDYIPWATPNICVDQVLKEAGANKGAKIVGELFMEEQDVLRLPDGRKRKYWSNFPDEYFFPPPPPTPPLALASYSIVTCLAFLILGIADAGKCRK